MSDDEEENVHEHLKMIISDLMHAGISRETILIMMLRCIAKEIKEGLI